MRSEATSKRAKASAWPRRNVDRERADANRQRYEARGAAREARGGAATEARSREGERESGVLLTHRKSWIHELGLAKDTDTRLYVGTQRSKIDPVGCGEWPAMTMTLALGVVANDDGVF